MPDENNILIDRMKAVNIGAELFADALRAQGVDTVQLSWAPPRQVALDPRIQDVLRKMGHPNE